MMIENKYEPGYDAKNRRTVDMFKSGIVDPMKVCRTALENAASVSSLLITTEAVVFEKKEKENDSSRKTNISNSSRD